MSRLELNQEQDLGPLDLGPLFQRLLKVDRWSVILLTQQRGDFFIDHLLRWLYCTSSTSVALASLRNT